MEDYLNETKLLYHYMDKCCELLSILFSEGDSSPTKKLPKYTKGFIKRNPSRLFT